MGEIDQDGPLVFSSFSLASLYRSVEKSLTLKLEHRITPSLPFASTTPTSKLVSLLPNRFTCRPSHSNSTPRGSEALLFPLSRRLRVSVKEQPACM